MKVLVLGGTGSIGCAIVPALQACGHEVLALGRSPEALESLRQAGAMPIEGNLRVPTNWIHIAKTVDAIIHAAAVWDEDMEAVDRRFIEALLGTLQDDLSSKALIYTGGCWSYGETGDVVATERTPLRPIASFAWSIPIMRMVLTAPVIRGMVIHPAMVYEQGGGVFEHMYDDARERRIVRVVGGEKVRWPLIHSEDLARLYVLMLEKGKQGDVYNAAAMHGVAVGTIARAIAHQCGIPGDPVVCDTETAMAEIGSWAEGYALDQQMSGEKAIKRLGWAPKHVDVFADITGSQEFRRV